MYLFTMRLDRGVHSHGITIHYESTTTATIGMAILCNVSHDHEMWVTISETFQVLCLKILKVRTSEYFIILDACEDNDEVQMKPFCLDRA